MKREGYPNNEYYSKALDRNVLAVANVLTPPNMKPLWKAYIGAVPGKNHDKEWELVAVCGAKLPKKIAQAIFPQFSEVEWRK